jgi:hypothetical protein
VPAGLFSFRTRSAVSFPLAVAMVEFLRLIQLPQLVPQRVGRIGANVNGRPRTVNEETCLFFKAHVDSDGRL